MKIKFMVPLVAVVFAIASAFTTKPLSQMGWFKDSSGVVRSGQIDNVNTDTHPCAVDRSIQCKVGQYNAYASAEEAAADPSITGLLKYNP